MQPPGFGSKTYLPSSHGHALVLVHPFNFGIAKAEREDTLRKAEAYARLGGGEPIPRERVLQIQADYLSRLAQALHDNSVGIGFVFEAVDQIHMVGVESEKIKTHIAHLETVDAHRRIWIVVPTRWGGVDPLDGWDATLESMAGLGLKHAQQGRAPEQTT